MASLNQAKITLSATTIYILTATLFTSCDKPLVATPPIGLHTVVNYPSPHNCLKAKVLFLKDTNSLYTSSVGILGDITVGQHRNGDAYSLTIPTPSPENPGTTDTATFSIQCMDTNKPPLVFEIAISGKFDATVTILDSTTAPSGFSVIIQS